MPIPKQWSESPGSAPKMPPQAEFEAIPAEMRPYIIMLYDGERDALGRQKNEAVRLPFLAHNRESAVAEATAVAVSLKVHWFAVWELDTKKFVAYAEPYNTAALFGAVMNERLNRFAHPAGLSLAAGAEKKFQDLKEKTRKQREEGR